MFFKRFFVGILLFLVLSVFGYANNYDLRNAKYTVMDTYKAEAFLSNDIYDTNASDEGIKKYYTNTDYAILKKYTVNSSSGFNAGLYELSNGKYIIAYGGTTATESGASLNDKLLDDFADIIADLNLLNKKQKTTQPEEALTFIDDLKASGYTFTKDNLIVTGHSLGGGLAQHASYNKGYKAVTFNSAPFPIPHNLDTYNTPRLVDVVNIMSSKDPLTSTLSIVEDYENAGHDFTKPYHEGELLTPISEILRKYDNEHTGLKLKAVTILALGSNDAGAVIQDKFADGLASVANDYSNSSVLKLLTSYYSTQNQSNLQDFLDALNALKDKDAQGFITHTKKAFDIESIKLNNLLIGQRIVLNTGTGHGMLDLIKASYRNINNLGLERIKTTNPEFYKYIKGTFVNDGVSFPKNSRMIDSIVSRVMYYYYKHGYEPLIDSRETLEWTQVQDAVASHDQIQNFSNKWLNLNGLIAQSAIAISDAMVGSGNMDPKTKENIAAMVLDSGKGEFINKVFSKEQAERVKIVEDCVVDIPWFKSVGDVPAEALKKLIGEIPDRVIKCASGQVVESTSRFVNAGRGTLSLREYNSLRIAHKYLDRFYVCGANNPQCMADAFGDKEDISDQLQYIMENIGADGGGLDWTIRNYAKHIIENYQEQIGMATLKTMATMSIEVQYKYNHGNRHTNTLDGFLRVVDYDEVENILWVNMRVENTSGREIMLTSFMPLIVSEGVETNLGGNSNDDIFDSFLGKTLAAGESRTFKSLPINLGELKIKDRARLALLIDYQSTDGAFKDHIQRIANFDVSTPTEDTMVQTIPYSASSGIINFELPTNTTLSKGVIEGNKGDTVSFSLGYDAKYLRECLAKAEEGTPHYKIQYIDKSTDASNTKVVTQSLQFDSYKNRYEFVMPSDKIELVDVSYVDFDTDDREVMHCPLPEWSNFISNDTNATDNNSTDSNTTGETYEECVARGGTEIGCRVGMHVVDSIYGSGYDAILEDKYLYTNGGSSIDIIDISNKNNLIFLSSFVDLSDDFYRKMVMNGNYLYTADNWGFTIINVTDKKNPVLAGAIHFDSQVKDIEIINDNYVVISTRNNGIKIIDVSNKQNPVIAQEFDSYSEYYSSQSVPYKTYDYLHASNYDAMKIIDNYVYIVDDGKFKIIDISDEEDVKIIGEVRTSASGYICSNLAISKKIAYNCGVKIDISDKSNPKVIEKIPYYPIAIDGNYIYVYSSRVASLTYGYMSSVLEVVDASRIDNPEIIDNIGLTGSYDMDINDEYIYTATLDNVQIINMNNKLISTLPNSGNGSRAIDIIDNYLYVANNLNGIMIYDISNKSMPILLGTYKGSMRGLYDVKVQGNYAYLADESKGSLVVIDIQDKTNPTLVTSINKSKGINNIRIDGHYLYTSNIYNKGIRVYDISDGSNPILLSNFYPYTINTFEIAKNYLYIGTNASTQVYDISNKKNPKWISTIDKPAIALKVIDKRMYIRNFKGLLVLDISNINSIKTLAFSENEIHKFNSKDFEVKNNNIYLDTGEVYSIPKMISNYSLKDQYYNEPSNLKIIHENYLDNSIANQKFTKIWEFNQNIENLNLEHIFFNYKGWGEEGIIKKENKLSISYVPDASKAINKNILKFTKDGKTVKVNGSETFWSITRTKANKVPKLADGQLGTLSGNSNGEYTIQTYDGDGQTTTLSVVDSAGGDVSIEGDTIHTSFDDGKSSHTIEVAISDGTETVVKEFTVLTLTQETMANYYSDVPTSHKDFDAIAFATQKGVVEGQIDLATGKHTFRPDDDASLAEVLKMVIKAENRAGLIDLETSEYYREVFPSWAMPYYSYARDADAIEHESTDLSVVYPTREEIAKLIVRTLDLESKLDLKKGAIGFDDIDSFSNEEMAHYGEYAKLFGLFMTKKNARPQETITRGELAEVIAKIFMIPKATLKVIPNRVEYGDSVESSLSNVFAQGIDASTHMLKDTQDELNVTYVAKGIAITTSTIDTNSIPSSTKTIYAVLDNNGVRNIVSAPIQLDFNDQDNDGVQDKNDKWTDDARYAYDTNNNDIPDILDIVYGLGDKTPSDTILIDGQEVPVEDVIFYGGWKASDEPVLTLKEKVMGTVEKGIFQYYKYKAKAGQHIHVVLSNLNSNLNLYAQDIIRPKVSDFEAGPHVSSGPQPTISDSRTFPGADEHEISFVAHEDMDIFIGIYGVEDGNYTLEVMEHADFVMSLKFDESIPTTISEALSYYSIHGTKGDTIKIQINTNTPPFGDFNNSGTMFVKVGTKPSDTLYDCKKAFIENNTYECILKLDSEDDVYIALKITNGTGSIGLVATLMELDTDNDGIPDTEDEDDDNDGVLDNNDDFPLNPNEWLDTDHDGTGNNADKDDDNDGISDADENKWNFDPLDASDGGNADADGDGVSNADEIEAGSDPLDANDTKKPKRFVPIMMDDMVVMVPLVD